MTDTEAKALAMVEEVRSDLEMASCGYQIDRKNVPLHEALCRVIEAIETTESRHATELRELKERFESFRQEVSDEVAGYVAWRGPTHYKNLDRFILPAPDPLVEVFDECFNQNVDEGETWSQSMARKARAAIEARGGKIGEAGE